MIIFMFTEIVGFIIDAMLIGIAFYSIRQRLNWKISNKLCLVLILGIFVLSDFSILPALYSLDATITIRNQAIATILDIGQDYPIINLFSPGKIDLIIWLLQALLASLIGNKIFPKKYDA